MCKARFAGILHLALCSRGAAVWRDSRRHPCRAAEAHLHGLVDHSDSPVAVLGQ